MDEHGREVNLAIKFTTRDDTFVIYTDMSKKKIESIPGVMCVSGIHPSYAITLDPRYSINTVIKDIAAAANVNIRDIRFLT